MLRESLEQAIEEKKRIRLDEGMVENFLASSWEEQVATIEMYRLYKQRVTNLMGVSHTVEDRIHYDRIEALVSWWYSTYGLGWTDLQIKKKAVALC